MLFRSKVFNSCLNLQSVIFNGKRQFEKNSMNVFDNCEKLNEIHVIKEYEEETFYGKEVNKDIEIGNCGETSPDDVKWFYMEGNLIIYGKGKIKNCNAGSQPWNKFSGQIKRTIIFEGVKELPSYFLYVSFNEIEYISLPKSLTSIPPGNPFMNCNKLKELNLNGNKYFIFENDMLMDINRKTLLMYDVSSNKTSIKLPESIECIPIGSFYCANKLSEIKLGTNVTHIGSNSIQGCSSLKSFEIPDKVTHLHGHPFMSCVNLTSFKFGKNIKTITGIFNNCPQLKPENVDMNGNEHFKIKNNFIMRQNETEINYHFECDEEENIKIPQNVTSLTNYAFSGSSKVKSIEIPSSVNYIGYDCFYGCSKLLEIKFYGLNEVKYFVDQKNINTNAAINSKCIIHVPSNYNGTKFCGKDVIKDL